MKLNGKQKVAERGKEEKTSTPGRDEEKGRRRKRKEERE
jgi:hypothetical protein